MSRRITTGLIWAVIAILTISLARALPFRYLIAFGFAIAALELLLSPSLPFTVLPQLTVLALAAAYFLAAPILPETILLILIASFGYDTFAYLIGKKLGNRFFATRPFPRISPNKTWEGLIGGVFASFFLCLAYLVALYLLGYRNLEAYAIFSLLGGTLAWLGDLLASATKRTIGMKDSSETLIDRPIFRHIEKWLDGHGGYLDRLDSIALVSAVTLLLYIII